MQIDFCSTGAQGRRIQYVSETRCNRGDLEIEGSLRKSAERLGRDEVSGRQRERTEADEDKRNYRLRAAVPCHMNTCLVAGAEEAISDCRIRPD